MLQYSWVLPCTVLEVAMVPASLLSKNYMVISGTCTSYTFSQYRVRHTSPSCQFSLAFHTTHQGISMAILDHSPAHRLLLLLTEK